MNGILCMWRILFVFRNGSIDTVSDIISGGSDISNLCALDHSCGGKMVY